MPALDARTFYRLMIGLFILTRVIGFFLFPLQITDSDQTVMWQAAADMARLEFHHPFWYGQNYSSNLEALLAVPLIWLQVPVNVAVPLISSIMSATPVLLFAHLAARKQQYRIASLVLYTPLLFPPSFWQVTMLSRGFIQGTFCVSLGVYILLSSQKPVRVVIAGFMAGIGMLQNPNSVFLLVAAIPIISGYQKHISRYTGALTGAGVAWLAWQALHALADRHPEYNIHPGPSTGWNMDTWWQNFCSMDRLLGQVFLSIAGPAATFILFIGLLTFFCRNDRKLLIAISCVTVAFLGVLGFVKLADGDHNIFFSQARFFISLPYALLLITSQIAVPEPAGAMNRSSLILPVLIFVSGNMRQLTSMGDRDKHGNGYAPVYITRISDLRKDCSTIKTAAAEHRISTIIQGDHHMLETVTCGCPRLVKGFPSAMRPAYERRQWIWQEYRDKTPGRILLLDGWLPTDSLHSKFRATLLPVPGRAFIMQTNSLSNRAVMQRLFPGKQFN